MSSPGLTGDPANTDRDWSPGQPGNDTEGSAQSENALRSPFDRSVHASVQIRRFPERHPQGRRCAHPGPRPLCRRRRARRRAACGGAALAPCPCALSHHRYRGGARSARRPSRAHRARYRRAGRAALRRHPRGREGRRAALSGAGARRGPPCRRRRRLHRRRHRRAGEGRRRGDFDRLGAAAPRGRRARCAQARARRRCGRDTPAMPPSR